jgi:hypothetical protein
LLKKQLLQKTNRQIRTKPIRACPLREALGYKQRRGGLNRVFLCWTQKFCRFDAYLFFLSSHIDEDVDDEEREDRFVNDTKELTMPEGNEKALIDQFSLLS